MGLLSWFRRVKTFIQRAVAAVERYVPEEVLDRALTYVRQAATRFIDNHQRREWAVRQLTERGVPESVARLAVELAVQLVKRELD